jgi:hypothetical protein
VWFWRFVHAVTVFCMVSYIAFDVLDVDLSDFPLKSGARQRVVVVAEVPKGTEAANLLEMPTQWLDSSRRDPAIFKQSFGFQQNEPLRTVRFRGLRLPIHRIIHSHYSALQSSPPA